MMKKSIFAHIHKGKLGILMMAFGLLENPHWAASRFQERMRFSRLQKAGYAQRAGHRAADSRGFEYEILDLYILGTRYAVRLEDLSRAFGDHGAVRVEEICRDGNYYLGAPAGLAQVSASGRGFNIELFAGGFFTAALVALLKVMEKRERYAAIVKIPGPREMPAGKDRRISPEQQRLGAFA